jgi:hypothetical protein
MNRHFCRLIRHKVYFFALSGFELYFGWLLHNLVSVELDFLTHRDSPVLGMFLMAVCTQKRNRDNLSAGRLAGLQVGTLLQFEARSA